MRLSTKIAAGTSALLALIALLSGMLLAASAPVPTAGFARFDLATAPESLRLSLPDGGEPVIEHIRLIGPLDGVYVTTVYGPDVYDIHSIVAEATAGATTERERALDLWRYVMAHYQIGPFTLTGYDLPGNGVQLVDQVSGKLTSFGYGLCNRIGFLLAELAQQAGFPARARGVTGHTTAELYYDGAWHMMDAMFGLYFVDPETGLIASADQVAADTDERLVPVWDNERSYYAISRFRAIARETYFTSTYDVSDDPDQYRVPEAGADPYTRAVSLRPGETMTLYYGPVGPYVGNDSESFRLGDETTLSFPATWANGVIRYRPALDDLDDPANTVTNLTYTPDGWRVVHPDQPGELLLLTHSPYFTLEGQLSLGYVRPTEADAIHVQLRPTIPAGDWQDLWSARSTSPSAATIPLPLQDTFYAYELRVILEGDARLTHFAQETVLQINPWALPEFHPGDNDLLLRYAGATGNGQLEIAWTADARPRATAIELARLSIWVNEQVHLYTLPPFEAQTDGTPLGLARMVNVERTNHEERNCQGWQQIDPTAPAILDYRIDLPEGERIVRAQIRFAASVRVAQDSLLVWVSPDGERWALVTDVPPLHTKQEWLFEIRAPLTGASGLWLRFEIERYSDAPLTCSAFRGGQVLVEVEDAGA